MRKMRLFCMTVFILSLFMQSVTGGAYYFDWEKEYPWAVEAVNYSVSRGILLGDEYGDLMLERKMTRSQMAKLAVMTFNLEEKTENNFLDTDKECWDYKYISTVAEYVPDTGNYFFGSDLAKREDFAVTIMNICKVEPGDEELLNSFADVSKVTPEYKTLMAAAVKDGILTGSEGNLKPGTYITRAEACTILYRAVCKYGIGETPKTETENGYNENSTDTTIAGEAKLTVEQAQTWARDKGGTEKYINIATTYWELGEIMGIRPEILYAQAGWETNYGKYTGVVTEDMNNWAGIKVYGRNDDAKDAHETFATPEEGARAHFNHMSAYIGVEPYGETHGRYKSIKSMPWAGTVKTLEELGGKWCPDTEYGIKILNNCLIPMSKY